MKTIKHEYKITDNCSIVEIHNLGKLGKDKNGIDIARFDYYVKLQLDNGIKLTNYVFGAMTKFYDIYDLYYTGYFNPFIEDLLKVAFPEYAKSYLDPYKYIDLEDM